jgi:integrase
MLLGHSSTKVTENYYAPWVRARQEQLEADIRRTWERPFAEAKGTHTPP